MNPRRFKSRFDSYYFDDYEKRFSVALGRHDFSIKSSLPLRIYLAEGISGKEFEERHRLLPFLQIAQAMHSEMGSWPEIDVEWELMCPGGALLLDVTSLSPPITDAPLPELLREITSKLDRLLESKDRNFSDAERHYRKELSGIAAFGDAITTIHREFEEQPLQVVNTNTKVRRLKYLAVIGSFADKGATAARLNNQLLSWAELHAGALSEHIDSKGAILGSTGLRSALPYLEAAKAFRILAPVGRGLILTNSGRTLNFLKTNLDQFVLTESERLFFLFELLHFDRDFIWPLLVLLRERPSVSKGALRTAFPEAYKAHLSRQRDLCGKTRPRRILDAALSRLVVFQLNAPNLGQLLERVL